jgi:hypothetical protein
MNENETFVANTEEVVVAENTEQTAEQSPKTYTEAEFNAKLDEVLGKKIARKEAKIRKEYERKYGDLTDVLKAGTGEDDVDKMTDAFRSFYQQKGIKIPQKPQYTDKDVAVLAKADAADIISGGFEDVVEEADRLQEIGVDNMTPREKALFVALTDHIKSTETSRELSQIGVTEDVYGSKEFQDYAGMFKEGTPIRVIYDNFVKIQPKKEIKTAGSMKNTNAGEGAIKDFYTPDEAKRFSKADFDKNPALYEAVVKSMAKWK